eukprot:gi/632954930/ref/XP_007893222.1/ PREDICTED: ATP-dependent DNA helicase Q4 isoform X1 [Callorhinchus milii]
MDMKEDGYKMDRYNEIKILLKKWETSFFEEHKRKPNKVDIGCASEETQKLYREYRAIKQAKEEPSGENDQSATSDITSRDSADSTQHHDKAPGSDIWGSHLNRGNRTAEKLSSKQHNSITVSAQYYGMKLKTKIGASGKERPISLRKTMTPRKPQMSRERQDNEIGQVSGTSLVTSSPSDSLEIATKDSNNEPDQLDFPYPMQKRATPSNASHARIPGSASKLEQLRQNVVRRMSSIDPGWLVRCQGNVQPEAEVIISGISFQPAPGRKNNKFDNSDHNKPLPLCDSASGPDGILVSSSDIVSANHGRFCPLSNSSTLANGKLSSKGDISSETNSDEINCNEQFSIDSNLSETSSPKPRLSRVKCDPEKSFPFRENETNCKLNLVGMDSGTEQRKHSCCEVSSEDACDEVKVDFNTTLSELKNDYEDSIEIVNSKKGPLKTKMSNGNNSRKRPREIRVGIGEGKAASPEHEGKAKKRRKSIRSSEASSTQKQKRKSTAASKSVNDVSDSSINEELDKSNSEMLRENLFGELEEEKLNSAPRKSIRIAPPKKDGNFVRINLKKKSHVRGNVLKGAQLRKQVWKQKLQMKGERFGGGRFNRSGDTCFRCGGTGHWAKDCRGQGFKATGDENAKGSAPEEEDIAPLPTLEEVARLTSMSCTTWGGVASDAADESSHQLEHIKDAEVLMNNIRPVYEPPVPPSPMEPLYSLREDGNIRDTPPEVHEALLELGYTSFRSGQELAVMRILSGLSSLVVLSTGMGKSLCYQLPAYLYAKRSKCITLVVSPLVSLMDDQVSGLPSNLKAICVHSNMSKSQREAAIAKVKAGEVHVLLLSPEALVGGGRGGPSTLPPAHELPPVAFACIDEAHCVSEWSHNFRPCYLRLCKVLKERLGVKCLLGLTATATLATARDVAQHFGIKEEKGIAVRSADVPENLFLSVSTDQDRDQALVTLLRGDRFGALDSIIVYCTRREETTRIAALLRTCLQGVSVKEQPVELNKKEDTPEEIHSKRKKALTKKKIRQPLKWMADSYHAGMSAAERRRVQNHFMSGQLRIVVATVAFGMGLDKSDVRGIIHYNMPKGFENYVQEIGRAGRDGKPAHCHLFLNREGGDMNELRRHIYADTVDYFTVKKLVQNAFPPCKCREIHQKQQDLISSGHVGDDEMMHIPDPSEEQLPEKPEPVEEFNALSPRVCQTHARAMPIQSTIETLDIREEGIETLLCYLELHTQHWVELMHPTLSTCRLVCYSGPPQLRLIARRCPPVAVAMAKERLSGVDHTHCSSLEFDVVSLADSMGWELIPVRRELRQLQWNTTQFKPGFQGTGKSGVLVEFDNLSFHFRSYGDLSFQELDSVCEYLHQHILAREKTALRRLQACFKAFQSVAFRNCSSCMDHINVERSTRLKQQLKEYFDQWGDSDNSKKDLEQEGVEEEELDKLKLKEWENTIRADIRQFLSIRHDERFSGRAIARIFHGIESPCYPAQVFGRDRRFWRKYLNFDFNEIIRLATEEIIRVK